MMQYSPDGSLHRFEITKIHGDWALKDSGHAIAKHTWDCAGLRTWEWHPPDAVGWAEMVLWVDPDINWGTGIGDAECVARAIKKAGGPGNSFCFQPS